MRPMRRRLSLSPLQWALSGGHRPLWSGRWAEGSGYGVCLSRTTSLLHRLPRKKSLRIATTSIFVDPTLHSVPVLGWFSMWVALPTISCS